LARLFSPKALGAVVMRSGWGPEDTWVLFKCGDYGDNHGHFDQGHFEIFRRGQLALDSFYGAKDTRYHNTILVNDLEDPVDLGLQRIFSRQVHRSLESYLADPIVRTGKMLHFSQTPRATCALGDATLAYPPTRVKSFTRQLVFLERKLVVIFDVVTAVEARFRRRFRLHYPTAPAIDGQTFGWSNNGARLTVCTLLPAHASIKDFPHPADYRPPGSLSTFQEFGPKGYVEVEPEEYESPTTFFLHVLAPQDEGATPPRAGLREESDAWVVRVPGAELTFAKSGREPCVIR
jgi:heparin/heparan-sulfate lyase